MGLVLPVIFTFKVSISNQDPGLPNTALNQLAWYRLSLSANVQITTTSYNYQDKMSKTYTRHSIPKLKFWKIQLLYAQQIEYNDCWSQNYIVCRDGIWYFGKHKALKPRRDSIFLQSSHTFQEGKWHNWFRRPSSNSSCLKVAVPGCMLHIILEFVESELYLIALWWANMLDPLHTFKYNISKHIMRIVTSTRQILAKAN